MNQQHEFVSGLFLGAADETAFLPSTFLSQTGCLCSPVLQDMLPHDAPTPGQPAQMAQAAPPLPDRSVAHSQINAAHGPGPSLLDLPEGVVRLLLQLLRGSPNRLALRCVCKHLKRLTDGLPCRFRIYITLPSQPEEAADVANQSELGSLNHSDMLSAAAHEQVMQQLATFPRCCNLVQLYIVQFTGGFRSHQVSMLDRSCAVGRLMYSYTSEGLVITHFGCSPLRCHTCR